MQQKWVLMLKSFIGFARIPYVIQHETQRKVEVSQRQDMFQVWSKALSGETRLLVDRMDGWATVDYDFKSYKEALFHHNKHVRSACMKPVHRDFEPLIVAQDNAYCSCYDCIAELNILREYALVAKKHFGSC